MNIIVQKYGGATLATPEKIKNAAKRIHELHQQSVRLVVVVSAMGQTTNELIQLAQKVSDRPHLREMDMLLTVGERISMSLLSMALNDLGCPAISFTGSQAGILTDEAHVNAKIVDVRGFRVEEALASNKVVIMAGFQGVSPLTKEITTLGRGGSDISAVAMAGFLKAHQCEILKDVDGIYTADPKVVPSARPIPKLSLESLLEMTHWGAKVLNSQSVIMALEKKVRVFVGPADIEKRFNSKNEIVGSVAEPDLEEDLNPLSKSTSVADVKPLALNSFQQILKLKISVGNETFFSELSKKNIGRPQILFQNNEHTYVTGPDEINQSLIKFSEQADFYQVVEKNLSSISVTYTGYTSDQHLQGILQSVESEKIRIEQIFNIFRSVHIFIEHSERQNLLKKLHDALF